MSDTTVRFIQTKDLYVPDAEVPLPSFEPTKGHDGDAAFDLRAAEQVTLLPGDRTLVSTGIALAIPEGYAGLVLPRSGMALKDSITVLNAPGLIDSGYRGDVGVILYFAPRFVDLARDTGLPEHAAGYEVNIGDRIAQLLIVKVADAELRHSAWLPHSERADGGFGSTGR